jgi:hypothetical protein
MFRTLVLTICAVCLLAPARILADDPMPPDDKKKLQTTLDQITEDLKEERRTQKLRFEEISQKLDDAKNKLSTIDNSVFALQQANSGNEKEIRALKSQIESLRKDMDSLRGQLSTQPTNPSTSFRPSFSPNMVAGLGALRVQNDYPSPMDVIVNGVTFQIMPFTTEYYEVPAGSFSYRIMGVDAATKFRTIEAGKTLPVRIYPRGQ